MKTVKYFCDGNTAKGYVKFFEGNFEKISKIYGITSPSLKEVNEILLKVVSIFEKEEKELIYRAEHPDWLSGVIFPKKSLAVVDTQLFTDLTLTYELVLERDLKEKAQLLENEKKKYEENKQKAYEVYATALKVHDEWEKPFIKHMDFEKVNEHTTSVIEQLNLQPTGKKGLEKHRFLGAATHVGAVDHLLNQTHSVENRIFIKGRPGSGKSTYLKKLARAAIEAGYEVETYHCGFDPNSLDMIIIRELNICTFDSTAPHEYFPQRKGDTISDHYELFIDKDTDKKYKEEIVVIKNKYNHLMAEAKGYLAKAKEHLDTIEELLEVEVEVNEELINNFINAIKTN